MMTTRTQCTKQRNDCLVQEEINVTQTTKVGLSLLLVCFFLLLLLLLWTRYNIEYDEQACRRGWNVN